MFPKETNSNGYQHQVQRQPPGMGGHRERVRRGTRRSRASSSSSSSRDTFNLIRVSEQHQQQQHEQQQQQRPPCTDFDIAYFHSYAHLGIHQEMIKVQLSLPFSFFVLCCCFFPFLFISIILFLRYYTYLF